MNHVWFMNRHPSIFTITMLRAATIIGHILIMVVIVDMDITGTTAMAGKAMVTVTATVTNLGNTTTAAICGLFVILLS